MIPETKVIKLSDIIFDEKLYPRKSHSPGLVQQYADNLDEIEARGNYISVSQNNILLDGRHRHLAYLKNNDGNDIDITVFVYPVENEDELFDLAVELNSSHGDQLSDDDKRNCVLKMYLTYGKPIEHIAKIVSVRKATALSWTKTVRDNQKKEENETIFNMYLACYTRAEIAEKVGLGEGTISDRLKAASSKKFQGTFSTRLLATFQDEDFKPPLYTVWSFAKKTNQVGHFGNSEQGILENLLYLYTEPFDIVLDPFAGGGSTIDVCKRRLRRYFVSDRKPIIERKGEIRELDITQDLPLSDFDNRWSDVALTYLDPPYWRQAQGKYSQDKEDLANMPLDEFTENMIDIINRMGEKQSKGVIAMLMQPTQWNADNRQFTDHVFDIIQGVNLPVKYRVSCPYHTEQYNAQQVNWAKENKEILVISRELVIWQVGK